MNAKSKQTYKDFVKFLGNKPWKIGFSKILGIDIILYPINEIIKNNERNN